MTSKCARCGAKRERLDMGQVWTGDRRYWLCHPSDSVGTTCYMLGVPKGEEG